MQRGCGEVRDLSERLYRWLVPTSVASVTAASTSDAGGPGVAVASVVAVVRVSVRSVGGERVLSWKMKPLISWQIVFNGRNPSQEQ